MKGKGRGSCDAASENISLESSSPPHRAGRSVIHTHSYSTLKVLLKTKLHLLWQRSGTLKDKTYSISVERMSKSVPQSPQRPLFPETPPVIQAIKSNPQKGQQSNLSIWDKTKKKWVFKLSANGAQINQILKKKHASKFGELLLLSGPDKKHLILCSHPH